MIEVRVTHKYRSEKYAMPSMACAEALADLLTTSLEELYEIKILEDGQLVKKRCRTGRYEWPETPKITEANKGNTVEVWVWSNHSIMFHAEFANVLYANIFVNSSKRAVGADQIQLEDKVGGKQYEWIKGENFYWGGWEHAETVIAADNEPTLNDVRAAIEGTVALKDESNGQGDLLAVVAPNLFTENLGENDHD